MQDRRPRLAKKAVVDLRNETLTLDGERFPFYITEDGIEIAGLGDPNNLPTLTFSVFAETVEVIPKPPRGEGRLDR